MPVTRQSTQLSHANDPYPSPTTAQTAHPKPAPNPAADVIILSSDDEKTCSGKLAPSKKIKKQLFSPSDDVLEISSSDDASTFHKVKSPWQRHLQNLKRANEHLERQLTESRTQLDCSKKRLMDQNKELATQREELDARCEEINARRQEIELTRQKLATLQSKDPFALSMDASKLEDAVSCDICTHLMYSPYLLIDCGHCYCEGCLKGWFDETLTNHIRAHPTYNMNINPFPPNFLQFLQTFGPYIPFHLRVQLQGLYNNSRQQQPQYTCPSCRKEVTGKPVVNYPIKEIVTFVGSVLGQPDTRRDSSTSAARRGQQVTVMGPFDGFFP